MSRLVTTISPGILVRFNLPTRLRSYIRQERMRIGGVSRDQLCKTDEPAIVVSSIIMDPPAGATVIYVVAIRDIGWAYPNWVNQL